MARTQRQEANRDILAAPTSHLVATIKKAEQIPEEREA